jgi:hypothetical protein
MADDHPVTVLIGPPEFRRPNKTPALAGRAVAVGDRYPIVLRGGRVELSGPVASADGFSNRPALGPRAAARCPKPQSLAGRVEPGDGFRRATDAAAAAVRRTVTTAGLPDSLDPRPLRDSFSPSQPAPNDDRTIVAIRPALPEPTP